MTKYLVLSAFLLAGCGGDEPSIFDETDSMVVDDTSTSTDSMLVDETSGEVAPGETGDETAPTVDSGATETSMTDAPPADSIAMDAPNDTATGAGITCGSVTCNASTQACCVTTVGSTTSCIPKADSCAGGKLACSAPDTCSPGQKCCLGTAGVLSGSTCKGMCAITEEELCDSDSDCSGGKTCKTLGGSPGLKRCN